MAFTFKKGVHPDEHKSWTHKKPIERLPLPKEVFIPLSQHIGKSAKALVKKKDRVKTGQIIAEADGVFSANIHSSITGTVKAVDKFIHPLGSRVPMIHIVRDEEGEEEFDWMEPISDWQGAGNEGLLERIFAAGVVGMGGAAFPTHIKFKSHPDKTAEYFVLNGCECEPYLTCDDRMMVEDAERILKGMEIMVHLLGGPKGIIGIEKNKPEAILVMQERVQALNLPFEVRPLEVKYPQGAEKMLIQATLSRKVPTGGLPIDVGCVVNNVGTAAAVYDAVIKGRPLIERVLTVSGDGINNPKNLLARIGTPFVEAIEAAGGMKKATTKVYMGGPMMGMTQFDLRVPILKATSGIICKDEKKAKGQKIYPCIRCNSCVSACPMFLLPSRIAKLAEVQEHDAAREFGIQNCIECGSCVFVCPSNIPLLQWIRVGKFQINAQQKAS